MATTNNLSPDDAAKKFASELLKKRRPISKHGGATFKMLRMNDFMLQPKFMFRDGNGNATLVRYAKNMNSIFAFEQYDGDDVRLERIPLVKSINISDPNLRDYLLIHPRYGRDFVLVDRQREAKEELERVEAFDEVYAKVRSLDSHKLKSLYLLLIPGLPHEASSLSVPELRVKIRPVAEEKPYVVQEALDNPILDTLYLYYLGEALKVIKYEPKLGAVKWAVSGKELCKVPASQDPAKHVARFLVMDENIAAKEMLEKELYD